VCVSPLLDHKENWPLAIRFSLLLPQCWSSTGSLTSASSSSKFLKNYVTTNYNTFESVRLFTSTSDVCGPFTYRSLVAAPTWLHHVAAAPCGGCTMWCHHVCITAISSCVAALSRVFAKLAPFHSSTLPCWPMSPCCCWLLLVQCVRSNFDLRSPDQTLCSISNHPFKWSIFAMAR
jgi:hypothetical protein